MVGRLVSFLDGLFLGAMLVFGGVTPFFDLAATKNMFFSGGSVKIELPRIRLPTWPEQSDHLLLPLLHLRFKIN